ncbi:ATP synthase subunit I [Myxosarcina sp. GI1]|uniref:ATP synthase subunit I n=1 Tax=Myxosarcina sp. GI1 TaxID=1541065 RepID=UPI0009DFCE41|nr:ATP synthase subunit I [Myxosarcina sp. GI1]
MVNLSRSRLESTLTTRRDAVAEKPAVSPEVNRVVEDTSESSEPTMQEYYQLKQMLLLTTLLLTGAIFSCVWIFYTFNIALNYLLGACIGVVYLGMLAREVERLGTQKRSVGSTRLALLAGIIIVATQLQQLQILPIFLGFMTYKAAIIVYVMQTTLTPAKK